MYNDVRNVRKNVISDRSYAIPLQEKNAGIRNVCVWKNCFILWIPASHNSSHNCYILL